MLSSSSRGFPGGQHGRLALFLDAGVVVVDLAVKNSRTPLGVGVKRALYLERARGSVQCSRALIRPPDAAGDGLGQAEKVLRVPGVEGCGLGFQRALSEKSVIDGAASQIRLGGLPDCLKIFAL